MTLQPYLESSSSICLGKSIALWQVICMLCGEVHITGMLPNGRMITQQRSVGWRRRHLSVLFDSIVAVKQHAGSWEGPPIETCSLAFMGLELPYYLCRWDAHIALFLIALVCYDAKISEATFQKFPPGQPGGMWLLARPC